MEGCIGVLLVVAIVIATIVWFANAMSKRQEEAAQLEARIARDEEERRLYVAEQKALGQQILRTNDEAISVLEKLPLLLRSAEESLDQAENDFADGAFAPFWDSVERAARALGGVEEGVRNIERTSKKYVELVRQYRGKSPVFAISPRSAPKLLLASETSARMNGIVRKAQRSFEFSVIYEQRKTNQVLVAGFRSLAQALDEMTWRITSSLDDLRGSVDQMHASLDSSLMQIREQTERIATATEGHRSDTARDAAGREARELKALEMLDNLQRKRYPGFIHGGLR